MILTVPLKDLAAGRYTCQVSVVEPAARQFAVWRSNIVIVREPAK